MKFLPTKTNITSNDSDLMILSKAEFNPKDEADILGQFPNYDIHYEARVMMKVKKDTVNITGLSNIEEPASSCMWFQSKT